MTSVESGGRAGDRPVQGQEAVVDDAITLDDFYEHAPVGYLSLTTDGRILRVNQTFLDWTAYTRSELTGRRFPETLSMGGRIFYETHCTPLLVAAGEVREIALDVKCADGHRLPVLLGATARVTEAGATVVRATVFDATQRRGYERGLVAEIEEQREARRHAEATVVRLSKAPRVARSDLSGLPNERWWRATLEREFREALRSVVPLTVAYVEIDHFERYSQVHGHVAGDALLLQVFETWRRAGHDLLARADDEAFGVPLSGLDAAGAKQLVTRLRRGVGAATEFSVGLATWDRSETAVALGERAQRALLADQRLRGAVRH